MNYDEKELALFYRSSCKNMYTWLVKIVITSQSRTI